MIYSVEKSKLLYNRLRKFTDSYEHIVVGQFANIDFWITEVIQTIESIDKHNSRFEKMYNTQKKWIDNKQLMIPNFCAICNGICEFSDKHYQSIQLPKKKTKNSKNEARRELIDTMYYFLIRCFKIGLVNTEELNVYCNKIGTSYDPNDLK